MKKHFLSLLLALAATMSATGIAACTYGGGSRPAASSVESSSKESSSKNEYSSEESSIEYSSEESSSEYSSEESSSEYSSEDSSSEESSSEESSSEEEPPVPNDPAKETEGLEYKLSKDGTYYTVKGMGTATTKELVIPASYNSLPVTEIGENAFKSQTELTSVVLPDSITVINSAAFQGCSSLKEIRLPQNITTISRYSFYACTSLISISLPESVTEINEYAFGSCYGLTGVAIPQNVTKIETNAFQYCYKLVEVVNQSSLDIAVGSGANGRVGYYAKQVIASKLQSKIVENNGYIFYNDNNDPCLLGYTGKNSQLILPFNIGGKGYYIYSYAFYARGDLTSISIPDRVSEIGASAFYNCENLTSVSIGVGVNNIGTDAFYHCTGIASFTVKSGNSSYQSIDGNLYSKDGMTLIRYATAKSAKTFTVPEGVTNIARYAFANCLSLYNVTLPDSLKTIEENAFYYCIGLISVTVPQNVTKIGNDAFRGCYKLVEVVNKSTLSMSIKGSSNGYVAYYAKQIITSDQNTQFITKDDFIFYVDGTKYYLVTYVGSDRELSLPTYISGNSYYGIYDYAFYESNITSIVLPEKVSSIRKNAFDGCRSLTEVTIGEGVFEIGDSAFNNCVSLRSIALPDALKSIGTKAFMGCENLLNVTFLHTVGWKADSTTISSSSLANSLTAAGYLTDTYCNKAWTRS